MTGLSPHPLHDAPNRWVIRGNSGAEHFEQLIPSDRSITIGRAVPGGLTITGSEVSREHAEFIPVAEGRDTQWRLCDLHSRHGTTLNNVPVTPGRPCVLKPGDRIGIGQWTFQLIDLQAPLATETQTDDDRLAPATIVRIDEGAAGVPARDQLELLLTVAEALQDVSDESALAGAITQAALRGTAFTNVAMLQPLQADGTINIIGDAQNAAGAVHDMRLSRTLLREASKGEAVLLRSDSELREAVSILQLGITSALCVPFMRSGALIGHLYLDRRGHDASLDEEQINDSVRFAIGLARLAGISMLSLARRDLEQRQAVADAALASAAAGQARLLPRSGEVGRVRFVGECCPGRGLSGDFYDVIPLHDGRVAISLGDVMGKGVEASVLMAVTQGFLRGAVMRFESAAEIVNALQAYVEPRSEGRFLSLWLGIIDPARNSLEYVDAGHGYAWAISSDGQMMAMDSAGGLPIGASESEKYQQSEQQLNDQSAIVVVSDGIIEQPGKDNSSSVRSQFGVARLQQALGAGTHDVLTPSEVLKAIRSFAGGDALADDATVLLVRW